MVGVITVEDLRHPDNRVEVDCVTADDLGSQAWV